MQEHDELGRPLPRVNLDHVHVYSQTLQLSLGPSDVEKAAATRAFGSTANPDAFGQLYPPLSPGPPLRGYAAQTLPSSREGANKGQREDDYQMRMQGILDRTRQANQQQEQDEDRRVERLLKHIAHEQEFVDDLDEMLDNREKTKFRRQQELCREWHDKVFKVIQGQIDRQLSALRTEDISERRRKLMEDYIRISNQKKFGLYRDIIIESEYDPHLAHRTLLKYQMKDENDPLKQEIIQAELGKPKRKELGRATLSTSLWDQLHSTPYGRFDRVIPTDSHVDPSRVSRVPFEHYNVATDRQTLMREFPRGKRIDCGGRDMRQSKIFAPMAEVAPYVPG